jgi:hypothetical protein
MSNKYIECFFEHSKTILFFKGEGDYFFRDPNWGVHLYYTPMSIVFDKIKENLLSLDDFLNGFYFFVSSLQDNEVDSEHFWQNVYAIYLCLNKKDNTIDDFFSKEYPCSTDVINYLHRVKSKYDSTFYLDEIKKNFPTAGILKL